MSNSSNTSAASALTSNTIHRLPALIAERGVSRSQHYLDIKKGLWTPPVKLGVKASGWPARETVALNAARIAGKTSDEIRALVQKLMSDRAALAA